jgi:DNA-binding NarL/FixJ family response regulator
MARSGPETGYRPGGPGDGEPVRVLAVDDQAIFLRALRKLIAAAPGFEQIGEARSGEEAIERAGELHPDLILVDVRMPGMDGLETARRLLAGPAPTTVVLISLEPLPGQQEILPPGVAAFLRKQELSVRTLAAVWAEHRPRAGAEREP